MTGPRPILAPQDMSDALGRVVKDHGQVVGCAHLVARQHDVSDRTQQLIAACADMPMLADRSVAGFHEPDRAFGSPHATAVALANCSSGKTHVQTQDGIAGPDRILERAFWPACAWINHPVRAKRQRHPFLGRA